MQLAFVISHVAIKSLHAAYNSRYSLFVPHIAGCAQNSCIRPDPVSSVERTDILATVVVRLGNEDLIIIMHFANDMSTLWHG